MLICLLEVSLKHQLSGCLAAAVISAFSPRYRIGPFEVESALMQHPAVSEVAVVSSPDPVRGEVNIKKEDIERNVLYSEHQVPCMYHAALELRCC